MADNEDQPKPVEEDSTKVEAPADVPVEVNDAEPNESSNEKQDDADKTDEVSEDKGEDTSVAEETVTPGGPDSEEAKQDLKEAADESEGQDVTQETEEAKDENGEGEKDETDNPQDDDSKEETQGTNETDASDEKRETVDESNVELNTDADEAESNKKQIRFSEEVVSHDPPVDTIEDKAEDIVDEVVEQGIATVLVEDAVESAENELKREEGEQKEESNNEETVQEIVQEAVQEAIQETVQEDKKEDENNDVVEEEEEKVAEESEQAIATEEGNEVVSEKPAEEAMPQESEPTAEVKEDQQEVQPAAEGVVVEEEAAVEAQQEPAEEPQEPEVAAEVTAEIQAEANELPAETEEEGAGDAETEKDVTGAEMEQSQYTQEQSDMNQSAIAPDQDYHGPPPAPHLPSPDRSHTSIEGQMSTSALNVVWSFGLNRNVPVLNLSDGVRSAIMYPCAHVGIMYDFKNNKQHILQAHLNPITCTAVSQDKRWLVTGDVGPDAMVNIWDTYTGTPIQTMFDPNPSGGVVAVALTPDSRYLATMSALPVQTLAIWDWTVDGDVPICSADLKPEYGLQNFIYFDPTDIYHVVTNSDTQVLFYHWDEKTMQYFAPPLTDQDFNKPVGRYSQSIFQMGIARALTATSIGNLVVWDNNKPLSKFMDVNQSADKKPLKIIKVHDKGINVLTTTEKYIVLGDTAGHVKFFDQGLRLIYWYADFNSGPCTAISFAHMPEFSPYPKEGTKFPSDATKQAKPFVVRDFVVGTSIAVYGNVYTDGSKFKVIHREHDAAVHALAAHPKLPIIAMGSYSGLLKLWNYRTKETVASRMFDKVHIQVCAFDPKGFYIAVGCTNGALYLVDSIGLLDQFKEPLKYAKDTLTHIAFSHNSAYIATADAGCAVTVYRRQRKKGMNPYSWHGRYRSHYKTIRDITFGIHLDTNEPKLLTLGEDRMLIEYDLSPQGKTKNHLVPCAEDRIEQSAMTQCMAWYPPICKENFLLTANDQYKLKCYNSVTKMCRKTVLGPTYGSPIRKMMVVPTTGPEDKDRYLAYITDDKVGLHFLPATGNPHLAMALIAHPSGVSNLACSFDGSYLFTAGGPDYAVHMWEINITALEAQAKLGGEDLVPFYGLLEGGRDGEMFAELEDLFYYAQLRHQGINSMETREIGNRVPISEVPFIMRAMGYYPSEQEIEDMLNEIKYHDYVNNGQYQEDIDLGSFIKLYINHRPAFGLNPEKLLWAFQTLAESPALGKGGFIERGDMLDMLQKNGEHMTEYELAEHLTTLLGFNSEGGSCEQEAFDAESASGFLAENLPYDINAEQFINEILGFSMTIDPPAPNPEDAKVVVHSEADN